MKIIGLLIPLALKLIHSWLETNEEIKEGKKEWMQFIDKMDKAENNSKRMKKTIKDLKKFWID